MKNKIIAFVIKACIMLVTAVVLILFFRLINKWVTVSEFSQGAIIGVLQMFIAYKVTVELD